MCAEEVVLGFLVDLPAGSEDREYVEALDNSESRGVEVDYRRNGCEDH